MKQEYTIRANVWRYPGFAGWHFVSIPKKQSAEINKNFSSKKRGWGSLPVTVTLGESTWKTSIFPSKEGAYLLALKADIRKKEHVRERDAITLKFILRV
jgi:hypothetical protein